MAGDHKCPVCQATFTRPQHVARHMRSHTGDRPYKCRLCGDQFARSDLLSRHVNKCHAGDKPPTTTTPARRKGHHGLSSTRATTSKQACDQCVINTLPCDGAFPCSKCNARKTPCTFVKFQRQTAPSGPGHKSSSNTADPSSSSSFASTAGSSFLAASVPRPDELFLGPPPLTVPSMTSSIAGDLFYPQQHPQFAYPPQQQHQQPWDNHPTHARSLSLSSSSATDSGHDAAATPDNIAARLRHAELVRSGLLPSAYTNNTTGNGFGYYASPPPQAAPDQWQFSSPPQAPAYTAQQLSRREKGMSDSFAQYLPNNGSTSSGNFGIDEGAGSSFQGGGLYSLHNAHHHPSARRGSIDTFSDGEIDGDGHSEPSQCNSASSSSIHLPLVDFASEDAHAQQHPHPHQQHPHYQALSDFDGYSSSGSHYGGVSGSSSDGYPAPPGSRDGRFATSFGDLSLSDPAAAAAFMENNPEGNPPFFSAPAMKTSPQDSTPRPVRDLVAAAAAQQQQLQQQQQNADLSSPSSTATTQAQNTRDREAEMRELRDFWKQYLRTPLTGPILGQTPKAELLNSQFASGLLDSVEASNSFNNSNNNVGRPGVKRGLSRVASLPSVRTPPEEKGGPQGSGLFQVPRVPASAMGQRDVPMQTPGGRGSSRTEDDLKRYEQAILARQHEAPLKLSIQPKARRGRAQGREGSQGSVSPNMGAATTNSQQQQHGGNVSNIGMVPQAYDGNGLQGMFVEPGPLDNPALSGLAHSDGPGSGGGTSSDEAPLLPITRAFPNLSHSRTTTSAGTVGTQHQGGAGRPSFKRLPSQTLENTVQKRAAVGRAGAGWGGEDAVEDVAATDSDEVPAEAAGGRTQASSGGMRNGAMPPPSAFPSQNTVNQQLGLMERYRRQSAPTGARPPVDALAGGAKQEATAAQ